MESPLSPPQTPPSRMQLLSHPRPHHRAVALYRFLDNNLGACKQIVLLSVALVVCGNELLEAVEGWVHVVSICGAENKIGSMMCGSSANAHRVELVRREWIGQFSHSEGLMLPMTVAAS